MDIQEFQDTTPIQKMLESLGVQSVFGEPTIEGDVVVIPVAQVELGFGYGGGFGTSSGEDGEGDGEEAPEDVGDEVAEQQASEGGGGGGGAAGRATPRGYIRITGDEVRYKPITDENRVPLAGILMVAWSVFWIALTIRSLVRTIANRKRR